MLPPGTNRFRLLAPLILALSLFGWGVRSGAIPRNDPFGSFQEESWRGQLPRNPPFRFEEQAASLGISHPVEPHDPDPALAPVPGVAVADFDNDGSMDLLFTAPDRRRSLVLYRNEAGKRFKDETLARGLGAVSAGAPSGTAAIFFDFDNDGWKDLFIARETPPHRLFRNVRGKFIDVSRETGVEDIGLGARSLNILDQDRDGFADLLLLGLGGSQTSLLLRNRNGVRLEPRPVDLGPGGSVAISDVDGDGYPDAYVARELGRDELYTNARDGGFTRSEATAFRPNARSRSSRSVEFGDFNNDGLMDLYISSIPRPGLDRGQNRLWRKAEDGGFVDLATRTRTDRCGWGWGARFLDANLDGRLDLFVANGGWSDGERPYWFEWQTWTTLPGFLREDPRNKPASAASQLASRQRSCLFWSTPQGVFDVAEKTGMTDLRDGRGAAVIDFDNNGTPDLVVANLMAPPVLYRNTLEAENAWIGFRLEGTRSNRDALGAIVRLTTSRNQQTRELFPANGFASQSDPRALFGLGRATPVRAEILWPSGARQLVTDLQPNRYHVIHEKAD